MRTSLRLIGSTVSLAALAAGNHVHAQDAAQDDTAEATTDPTLTDDLHDRRVNYHGRIVVSAQGIRDFDLLAGTDVV
ncbi:MAG: hypothetical protein VX465_06890, partial [Pseudomonadota bacterium]|nr:hypothetical protein [Pseudomonadota bacterium]